jgi:hypothetical protein
LALVNDGVVLANAPTKISVVTLNFLANGGDGYPMKAVGENFRYLLDNNSVSRAVDEALDFTAQDVISAYTPMGVSLQGEQQATRSYLQAQHSSINSAYSNLDKPIEQDARIQNLNYRGDTVLAGALSDASGPTADLIHGLYITMYDRTADYSGLSYWLAQTRGAGSAVSLSEAQSLGAGFKETQIHYFEGKYGVLSSRSFVEYLYENLGGSTTGVGDSALRYWQSRLDTLSGDRGSFTGEFVKSFLDYNGNDPIGLSRQAMFENKVAVSKAWADASRHNPFMNTRQVDDPAFRAQQIIVSDNSISETDLPLVLSQVGSVASARSLDLAFSIVGSSPIHVDDLLL